MDMMGGVNPVGIVIVLAVLLLFLAVWFQIYSKAGYSGWLCLLMIVPLVNLITILWFAFFAQWPVRRGAAA